MKPTATLSGLVTTFVSTLPFSPGYMDTALNRVPALDAQERIWVDNTPQKRLGTVDEVNNLAVFLSSEKSSYITRSNVLIGMSSSTLRYFMLH
jgi:NAD(P)-dependent dehydrogenase (short-subunit alcohol dehydrogenase family)